MENGPGLKMYFLLNMGIFQPAMLVYRRVLEFMFIPQLIFFSVCFNVFKFRDVQQGLFAKIHGMLIQANSTEL